MQPALTNAKLLEKSCSRSPLMAPPSALYSFNSSETAPQLIPSIYPGEPGKTVSYLEIGARGFIIISLAVLYRLVRRNPKAKIALDEWGAESHAVRVQRRYAVVVLWDLFLALAVISFMCLPVRHDGIFAGIVFGGFRPQPPPCIRLLLPYTYRTPTINNTNTSFPPPPPNLSSAPPKHRRIDRLPLTHPSTAPEHLRCL